MSNCRLCCSMSCNRVSSVWLLRISLSYNRKRQLPGDRCYNKTAGAEYVMQGHARTRKQLPPIGSLARQSSAVELRQKRTDSLRVWCGEFISLCQNATTADLVSVVEAVTPLIEMIKADHGTTCNGHARRLSNSYRNAKLLIQISINAAQ